jgi:hypothetical protein
MTQAAVASSASTLLNHGNPANYNPPSVGWPCVLVFLKGLAAPVVLYTSQPQTLYEELRQLCLSRNPNDPKLIEQQTLGPLKQVCFWDTELMGVALQSAPPSSASSL